MEKLDVREVLGLHRNPRGLHEALFPNARGGNFRLDESRIDPASERIYQLYLCFVGMDDTTPLDGGMIGRILNFSEKERSMFDQFALDNDPIGERIDWDDPRELYFPDSMNDLYEGIERKVSTFFDMVSFDTKYHYDRRILHFLRSTPYILNFQRQDLTKTIRSMSSEL